MNQGAQRRENFRIVYPSAERATAIIAGEKFAVVDLAAAGLKIHAREKHSDFEGMTQEIEIEIKLVCGKSASVVAKFLRCLGEHVVFVLTLNVPSNLINQEQIYIRKKYPAH